LANLATHEEERQFYATHMQDVSKLEEFFSKFNPKNILNHRYGTNFENVTLSEGTVQPGRGSKQALQTHQILGSESMWAIGLEESETECSILNAYYDLINNAKEFIYIENQFFISEENRVAKCICNKILEAVKQKRKFRVIVLLPSLPGFEGHPANEKAAVFRVQVHLHLRSINYVYHKLRRVHNLDDYLFFFSLRAHARLAGRPVTEIIYIHSKVLIVDDRVALIGSANINDRSLLGSRDTELAVVVEDEHKEEIKVGEDHTRQVSRFAHSLRKELYMEHFALADSEASDYLNDDVWDAMVEISRKNHYVYRSLFGCYPDDEMTNFQKMEAVAAKADPSQYDLLAPLIKGQAVPFQRHFLREENLELRPSQKEYFVPAISFT
jgi:phospholipase D1/2